MKKNIITSIALGLLSFIVYFLTAPASIYTGDSGEIATAALTWGVAHPTGFPVYLILGKLFSYLVPFGEFAFKLNIFSAFTSALTAGILFLILRKLNIHYWTSIAVSLSLAFAHTFWSHATVVRVYSLSGLFFALAILILLNWLENKKNWKLYLLAIICGLGAGTHLTFLLIFPFLFVYLVASKQKIPIKKLIICFLVFLLFCFLAYSYIYFRASQSPELNWGDPSTPRKFVNYITQKDYAEKIGARSFESWTLMLKELGKLFSREFTFIGLIFVLAGLWIAKKKYKEWFWAGLAVIILNILLLANYGNSGDIIILYRYFLPSYIVMAIFIAIALQRIASPFAKGGLGGISLLILPLLIFGWHFQDLNRRDYTLVQNTTKNILESVPQNSILITGGDTLAGAMMYEQIALGSRSDLVVINDKLFTHQKYKEDKQRALRAKNMASAESLVNLIENNQRIGVYSIDNTVLKNKFDYLPNGLTYKSVKKGDKGNYSEVISINKGLWKSFDLDFLRDKNLDKEYFNKELVGLYIAGLNNYAAYLTNRGNIKYVEEGIKYFKKSLEIRENKNALYNLAGIYNALGRKDEAGEYKKRFDKIQ